MCAALISNLLPSMRNMFWFWGWKQLGGGIKWGRGCLDLVLDFLLKFTSDFWPNPFPPCVNKKHDSSNGTDAEIKLASILGDEPLVNKI